MTRLPRGLRAGAVIVAVTLATAVAAAYGAPVNPDVRPVVAVAELPADGTSPPVRLRVTLPSGTTVALTSPRRVTGSRVAIPWGGRRGAGADGKPVRDGRYALRIETADGRPLATRPAEVLIDMTAPRVRASRREPTLPAPAEARVDTLVRDRDWGRAFPVRTRVIVRSLAGVTLGAGPWVPAGPSLGMPSAVMRADRVGAVRVSVQARDAAGNRAEAPAVTVSLPGRRAPIRVISEVRTSRPLVALTIDDGYDASAVDSMIATATRMRAPVTMCINGSAAAGYPAGLRARLRRATAAGWVQACSHGYSHGMGSRMSYSQAYRDLQTSVTWDRASGQSSVPFYRPPYGDLGANLLAAATDLRYRYVLLWDVDTNDWRHRSTGRTVSHVLGNASRGSIVLMHAIPSSAAALPAIISGLRARGLEPVAIGDLIAAGRPVR
jgi:peptidoglycan/xylan/chitin deacetylase (PgdA/CDA1 family)